MHGYLMDDLVWPPNKYCFVRGKNSLHLAVWFENFPIYHIVLRKTQRDVLELFTHDRIILHFKLLRSPLLVLCVNALIIFFFTEIVTYLKSVRCSNQQVTIGAYVFVKITKLALIYSCLFALNNFQYMFVLMY